MRTEGTAQELQERRFHAVELVKQGQSATNVAKQLGVSHGAVSKWKSAHQQGGPEALKARPHPGPKPKLTDFQKQRLHKLLLQGPRKHGHATELWTLQRIAQLIRRHFGVTYNLSGVWNLLRSMGWSCQKPEKRAREGDEAAVETWRHETWPHIKKGSKKR